jgi:hypothetical protein
MECEGFIKVGIAVDMKRRLADMTCHNPFPVRVISAQPIRADGAGHAERLAHEMLAELHHRGEWFRCPPRKAIACITAAIYRVTSKPMPYDIALQDYEDFLLARMGDNQPNTAETPV